MRSVILFAMLLFLQLPVRGTACQKIDTTRYFQLEALKNDAKYLENLLIKIHPSFTRYESQSKIDSAFSELKTHLVQPLTHVQYWKLLQQLVVDMGSGHTTLQLPLPTENKLNKPPRSILPLSVLIENDQVIIKRVIGDNDSIKAATRLLAINNHSITVLLNEFRRLTPGDGISNHFKDYEISKGGFITLYHILYPNEQNFLLKYTDVEGKIKTLSTSPVQAIYKKNKTQKDETYRKLTLNKNERTAVLRINSFLYTDYLTAHYRIFERLKKDSINRLLIDLRGNTLVKRSGISDFTLEQAHQRYGKNIGADDIFYYIYGFLHSEDYRRTFSNDLKKMLPRLPFVDDVRDFWKFSKAGRELADIHLNYEDMEAYPDTKVIGRESDNFRIDKMRFPKKDEKNRIIYNHQITIENIPAKAFEYIVNGKSAIEWIMERYQVSTHKDSGIVNNPNDWVDEVGKPTYILDLLLSVITVSVRTMEIVEQLPRLDFSQL